MSLKRRSSITGKKHDLGSFTQDERFQMANVQNSLTTYNLCFFRAKIPDPNTETNDDIAVDDQLVVLDSCELTTLLFENNKEMLSH